MNLKQLEAFVHVAESRSFSKAARDLYLTQPTISAHVSSLEKELKTRLFVRNTKEVSLSDDGSDLYRIARQIVDLEKQIEARFVYEEDARQSITIAASTIPAQYLLPEVLLRFNERYPGIQLKIMEIDSSGVVNQIVDHMAEIGFTGTVLEKKHCKYIPFFKDELVIITPNNEKFRSILNGRPNDVSWVLEEPIIMREEGSGTRREAEKQLRHAGVNPMDLNIVASIENQVTIKKSVSQGMGISLLSRLATTDEVEQGTLLAFPIPMSDDGRDINLVYNKNHQLSKVAERFIRVVKEVYGVEE
jgi:DNA-binding transcriptional LysR family regulator